MRIGDVLVVRGNGNKALVGRCGMVSDSPPDRCIFPDILIRIRPGQDITPWFLVSCLNCHGIRPQIENAARTAAGIWKISGSSLQSLRLPLPSIAEQHDIQCEIERATLVIVNALAAIQQAIASLREYRTALISAAVTGKIDVRNEV